MKRLAYLVLTILVLKSGFINAQSISIPEIENNLNTQIEKIISETGIPSISYAIFSNDSVMLRKAIGFSNVALKIPATTNTLYNTGSTFKVITAMGIMQLHASNQLNIDFPITKYLNQTSYSDLAKDSPVTLRHLLSHRSGLNGETINIPIWARRLPEPLDSVINGVTPYQKPGLEFKYCNHCYGISGYIIQNITGKSFSNYFKENFFVPLAINNVDPFEPTPAMIERMALPYYIENNKPVPTNFCRYNVFPAGDAYFTPSDMGKLLIPQLNNGYYKNTSVLDSSSIKEMQTNQFTPNNYGLGIGVSVNNGTKLILHGGSVPGFSAYYILDTNTKKGFYVMANCGDSGNILSALSVRAILLLRGENQVDDLPGFAKKEFKSITLDFDILKSYEGKYQLSPEVYIDVFIEKQNLFIQISGQSKVQIFPYEKNKFFIKVTDAQIEFNIDSNGNIESLTLFQNGKSVNGKKK